MTQGRSREHDLRWGRTRVQKTCRLIRNQQAIGTVTTKTVASAPLTWAANSVIPRRPKGMRIHR